MGLVLSLPCASSTRFNGLGLACQALAGSFPSLRGASAPPRGPRPRTPGALCVDAGQCGFLLVGGRAPCSPGSPGSPARSAISLPSPRGHALPSAALRPPSGASRPVGGSRRSFPALRVAPTCLWPPEPRLGTGGLGAPRGHPSFTRRSPPALPPSPSQRRALSLGTPLVPLASTPCAGPGASRGRASVSWGPPPCAACLPTADDHGLMCFVYFPSVSS